MDGRLSAFVRAWLSVGLALAVLDCSGSQGDGAAPCSGPVEDGTSPDAAGVDAPSDSLDSSPDGSDDSTLEAEVIVDTGTTPPPPPVGPCDATRDIPAPRDEGTWCTAVVTLDYATHDRRTFSVTCGGPYTQHLGGLSGLGGWGWGAPDADGLRFLAQAYSPAHAIPQAMTGSPYAFFISAADGVHYDFLAVLDPLGGIPVVLRTASKVTIEGAWKPSYLLASPSCLPTTYPPVTAVYPPSAPFDDGLATTVMRHAWSSDLGYAWTGPRGTTAQVLRVPADGKAGYAAWIVVFTIAYDSGGI